MELLLERAIRTKLSTIGILLVDGNFECYILEDTDRGLKSSMPLSEIKERKIYGATAIPEGRYQVLITYSPAFKKALPLLVNVPGYEGIRIHAGNTPANTLGCLLPGTDYKTDELLNSRIAFNALYDKIQKALAAGEEVFITVQL